MNLFRSTSHKQRLILASAILLGGWLSCKQTKSPQVEIQTAMGDINSGNSLILHLTGVAGWMAQEIYLPQALSVYLTALGAKFIISFIPFAR